MVLENQDLSNLSDEELAALLEADGDQEDETTSEDMATEDPQGVTVPQPSAEEMAPESQEQPANGGDYKGAMYQEREGRKQEREARMQAEERARQLEAVMQDPEMLRQLLGQYEPQQGPELAIEDPEAIQQLIQQAIAPYAQQLQQMQGYLQQTQAEKQALEMRQQHPDFDDAIAAVDQQMPHLAGLPAQEKHLVGQGLLYRNPEYLSRKMAAQMEAAKMEGLRIATQKGTQSPNQPPKGLAMLSSVTPGLPSDKDPRDMSDEELEAASRL